jgi:hypothetical protein
MLSLPGQRLRARGETEACASITVGAPLGLGARDAVPGVIRRQAAASPPADARILRGSAPRGPYRRLPAGAACLPALHRRAAPRARTPLRTTRSKLGAERHGDRIVDAREQIVEVLGARETVVRTNRTPDGNGSLSRSRSIHEEGSHRVVRASTSAVRRSRGLARGAFAGVLAPAAVLGAQLCRGTRSSHRGGHGPKSNSPCGGPLAGRMGSR